MNIQENNKLIAEFMGWEIYKNVGREVEYFVKGQLETHHKVVDNWLSFLNMKYHSSWDWLMPCIQKILNLEEVIENMELFYEIRDNIPDIDQTYSSIVTFLKSRIS